MKKIILICSILISLSLSVSGCRNSNKKNQSTTVSTTKTTKQSSDPLKELNEKIYKEKQINQKKIEVVKEFGERWSNFSSVDERNKSVKELMTEECIKDNGIDVPVHAEFKTTGKIYNVYQSTEEEDSYVIIGSEEAKGVKNTIVLNVYIESIDDDYLVSRIVVNYVRQAY